MNVAIILAGGMGTRVGADTPKQFVKVLDKPVLAYTVEVYNRHAEIDAIEIVCLASHIEQLKSIMKEYNLNKVRWITKGGSTFQESVINGVNHLNGKVKDEDIVLIHYGASPFVTEEIISDGIKVCGEKGNCTSASPCYLLMGSNDDGQKSSQWVDRDKLMQLNCPQCFQYHIVRKLYEEAKEQNLLDKVEPHTTSLMFAMGKTIYFSKGNQTNIKITTKEDIDLFEGYVRMKKSRGEM